MSKERPKIGLALSGASGRAIAHIGVLEVFREHNIPIDYITACSSATIVAASFACKTMEALKGNIYSLDKKTMFGLLDFDKKGSGLFSLNRTEEAFRKFTLGKKFEEVRPMLSFVACDIDSGESVGLNLGDMARAARVSCAVPGLFAPGKWGNQVLVDGGLFSLVPVEEAKKMGADIVIGVDIAATKYMYNRKYLYVWRSYSWIKNIFPFRLFRKIVSFFSDVYKNRIKVVFYSQSDFLAERLAENDRDLFSVLGKAMDLAVQRLEEGAVPSCDIMLAPKVKHFGKADMGNVRKMYEEGRRVTEEALPEIKKTYQGKAVEKSSRSGFKTQNR